VGNFESIRPVEMAAPAYTRGLHDVGDGLYAYLQPDGGWGWSNAGLVVDGEASLLVDTLFDLRLTGEMLDEMKRAAPAAAKIDTLVNTHANGDHTFGNQLVKDARIVATRRTAEEMDDLPPAAVAAIKEAAPQMGRLGEFWLERFGEFEFQGIELVPPGETFDGELELRVGDRTVKLIEVGPAHTRGDTLALVPDARVLYAGDVLFHGGHPIVWAGPVSSWIAACDRILAMDVDVIVPGHGPLADKEAVGELKSYFEYLFTEARKRYEAGMSPLEAARDIALDRYASWGEAERVVVNVDAVYRELAGDESDRNVVELFGQMAELSAEPAGESAG
jgi:glyoxylase-like metal-dependent hydrolase (beta-lactamase superfamily II)